MLHRAQSDRRRLSHAGAVLVAGWWCGPTRLARPGLWGILALAVPLAAVVAAVALVLGGGRGGRAFAATAVAIGGIIAALFANLYPNLLVSTTDPANTLTVSNSTASAYSLQVMTVVAAVMVPLVLLYQGWTYYVFRRRVAGPPAAPTPATPAAGALDRARSTTAARMKSLTRFTSVTNTASSSAPAYLIRAGQGARRRPAGGQTCGPRPPRAGPTSTPRRSRSPRRPGW